MPESLSEGRRKIIIKEASIDSDEELRNHAFVMLQNMMDDPEQLPELGVGAHELREEAADGLVTLWVLGAAGLLAASPASARAVAREAANVHVRMLLLWLWLLLVACCRSRCSWHVEWY